MQLCNVVHNYKTVQEKLYFQIDIHSECDHSPDCHNRQDELVNLISQDYFVSHLFP